MLLNRSLAIALFLLLTPTVFVFAELPCQYIVDDFYQVDVVNFYSRDTNQLLTLSVRVGDFLGSYNENRTFKIYNDSDFPVLLRVSYQYDWSDMWGAGGTEEIVRDVGILQRDFVEISQPIRGFSHVFSLRTNSVKWFFLDNNYYSVRYEKETQSRKICKPCLDKNCLNDGQSCSTPIECGGGFCVRGVCNNKNMCFNNDCKCSIGEIQCSDNSKCVVKNSLNVGSKPVCMSEECETNYVSAETGFCDERKETKLMNALLIYSIISIIIIAVIGFVVYKIKNSPRNKVGEIERESKDILEYKNNISKLEELINNLKEKQKRTNKEQEILDKKVKELTQTDSTLKELMKKNEADLKDFTKPYASPFVGGQIFNNPDQNYYPCFVNNPNNLVHKYLGEKIFYEHADFFKKQYPGKTFEELEVHHIDAYKLNFNPNNLVIISREQHSQIRHKAIGISNRSSGIKELKRVGVIAPNIPELK